MPCTKVKYRDEKSANADIARILKVSTRDKVPIRAYLCDKCGLWHITSNRDYLHDRVEELEKENEKLHNDIKRWEAVTNDLLAMTTQLRNENFKLKGK